MKVRHTRSTKPPRGKKVSALDTSVQTKHAGSEKVPLRGSSCEREHTVLWKRAFILPHILEGGMAEGEGVGVRGVFNKIQ
jgi:hypothetical protein